MTPGDGVVPGDGVTPGDGVPEDGVAPGGGGVAPGGDEASPPPSRQEDAARRPEDAAPSSAPVVVLEGVSKRYPGTGRNAVNGVSLTAEAGEILAVVGESGCGKTTLLRLIAGLEVPDEGSIRLDGAEMAGPETWLPPEDRGTGLVFQDFALFPHLTVRDNVAYGLGGRKRDRRARADALLAQVELGGLGDRYPHQLSGGQQQRVAVARALAPEPRVVLLDEPFSNLDRALKDEVRDDIGEILRASGATAILVVHDSDDVMALADRVAVMRDGRILQVDQPSTVYRRPCDAYAARFFGETNLFVARPARGGFQTPFGFVPARSVPEERAQVTVCVRPEDLQLSVEGGRGRAAVVRRVRHHGVHQRVLLSLHGISGAPPLRVHAPTERPLSEGDIVYVRIRNDAVQVIAGPPPEGSVLPGPGLED